ncbi:MAG: hypothetical protein M3N54_01705, partial [Acidobacteriota bacterium]|nr:hypothetical protein [Acidobacteriota bacterium]
MPSRKFAALLLPLLTSGFAFAQNFDTSGNGSLKGDYFIREVLIGGQNATTGVITSANSVIGVATFDGSGNYSFKGQGTGTGGLGTVIQQAFTGTYSAGANGLLAIQSFVSGTENCYGGVSAIGPSAFVASATEGSSVDILVAIPAGPAASAGSFKGAYTAGYIDFLNADVNSIRQATFNVTADGAGNLGSVAVTGNAVNLSSGKATSQTVAGVTYTLGGTGTGTVNFGTANSGQLISGSKTLYISADGGIILGGTPGGFDLLVGIRAVSGPATNATASGVYYLAALEDAVTQSPTVTTHAIDGYYGSTNANGAGVAISHNRIQTFAFSVYDFTYNSPFAVGSAGTFSDGQFYNYTLGANGSAFIATGSAGYYSLLVGLGAPKFSGPGVYLNPLGIVSAASFAPITNPIAPNEIVTIFGSGLSAGTVNAAATPLPTVLGNVQVLVNGQAAPLFYVTPGQIAFVVPQKVSPFFKVANATIQVVNNGVKSNPVTVYTSLTAPGVFSASGNGIGPALAVHLSGALVTTANPAKVGETVVVYATGLGSTTPTVPDGFPAPTTTLSPADDTTIEVDFGT